MNKDSLKNLKQIFDRKLIIILSTLGSVFIVLLFMVVLSKKKVDIDAKYEDKYDVALYIKTYHELPSNYITWYSNRYNCLKYGDEYLSDDSIIVGGDDHKNTGELVQFGVNNDVLLKECDIKDEVYSREYNNEGKTYINGIVVQGSTPKRDQHRFVYTTHTENVRVFETTDHYETYTEITNYDIMPFHYVSLYIFIPYTIISVVAIAVVFVVVINKKKISLNQK